MATPPPIYISSPGLLLSKNTADTQVVLLPPASTIGSQVIVRDASGTASLLAPIVISTTHGALFAHGLSTFYITDPYTAFAAAALRPSLYTPLYASSFVPTTRYGTESNFTPQFQYISSAFTAASFQALGTTTLQGTLINGAPQFVLPTPFSPASLSTTAVSTAEALVTGPYAAGAIQATNSYSEYLSAGLGVFSTVNTSNFTITGSATLQSTLRTQGSFAVTGNAALAGSATFADVSANGYWSTLGTIGIGGDISGYTFRVGGSVTTGAPVYARDGVYVSTGSVGATLSTVIGYASTAVYSGGLGMGVAPGSALAATLDVSGGGAVSGWLTAAGISTFTLSTATAVVSSATLRDINTPYSAYDLKVQGGQLFVGGSAVGSGGGTSAEFLGNSFTASNYLYGTSSIVSSITVGSTIVNPDFNVAVYGDAHTSSGKGSTLMVAIGLNRYYPPGHPSAPPSPSTFESIYYSLDNARNWIPSLTGGFIVGTDVAWNGRMWVAVGNMSGFANANTYNGQPSSTIQYSLNGSNWNSVFNGGFATACNAASPRGYAGGTGISWNGRMWIASGEGASATDFKSTLQYSYDGSNFFAINSATGFVDPGTTYLNVTFRPIWNGRMWIAGRAVAAGTTTNNACYSYDGLNWFTLNITPIPGSVINLVWNGSYWLAFGRYNSVNGQSVAISYDGFRWTASTLHPNTTANAFTRGAAWDGRSWITLSDGAAAGKFALSYNNKIWNSITTTGTSFLCNVVATAHWNFYNPGGFNCNWQGTAGNIYSFCGNYYAIGGTTQSLTTKIIKSSNGINWDGTVQTELFRCAFYGYGGTKGFALGFQSNIESDLYINGANINTLNYLKEYQSTAQIYSLSSLVTFNQTLFVDSTGQTAINSYLSSISGDYTLYVDGSMYTNGAAKLGGSASWTAISDERVKEDIQIADLSACYHTVRNLHVHNYKFKDEYITKYKFSSKPRYGLYADEVEQVLPEAVIETELLGENIKMLDMEPVYMMHYGATSYLYSTLQHQTSTIAGGHTYITAAGPLQDISGVIHGNPTYRNIPSLVQNIGYIYDAHRSNYE
jgi:hypothetical protein